MTEPCLFNQDSEKLCLNTELISGKFPIIKLSDARNQRLIFRTDRVVLRGPIVARQVGKRSHDFEIEVETSKAFHEWIMNLEEELAAIARRFKKNYVWFTRSNTSVLKLRLARANGRFACKISPLNSDKDYPMERLNKDSVCQLDISLEKLRVTCGICYPSFEVDAVRVVQDGPELSINQ